ncbi:MAG: Nucleotidyltransferase domain protein [Candidatus Hydrogenedentes bacterium ADurb.Bin101]|jgi:predicted nucleotidyltransferase|nr:MAG: Nucleotidyltransferase domain protein [Candidatus Hydrogenedentes bacterium ADurb.Bin101]HOC67518.1 nucleotidyltransferase domain-containing protein [Candidatus Hydrogenedentota bacterium]
MDKLSATTIDQATLDEIIRRILAVASPEKIILFGSAATGTMTADSDIDLLIVKRDITDRRQEYVRIRRALRDIAFPFDIILTTSDYYESTKDVVGGIAYPVNKEGRVLYAAA